MDTIRKPLETHYKKHESPSCPKSTKPQYWKPYVSPEPLVNHWENKHFRTCRNWQHATMTKKNVAARKEIHANGTSLWVCGTSFLQRFRWQQKTACRNEDQITFIVRRSTHLIARHVIWYMIYDIWYMIYDIWYMIYDIWYMIYNV